MTLMKTINCFKAYDVRGQLGTELNEDIAYRIARAFAQHIKASSVAVGCDNRLSSPALKQAVTQGLLDQGCDVIDLGMTGTEQVYYAAMTKQIDGGIQITASHNPIDYNGLKFIGRRAKPLSTADDFPMIRQIAEQSLFKPSLKKGTLSDHSILDSYLEHLLSYINISDIQPLKIVTNPGHGCAGHVIDALEKTCQEQSIPIEFIKIYHDPDGHFPAGIPNPLLPENRSQTAQAVLDHSADCGIAWDGDFDRCFLFDEQGQFIEGYYIVGLLAQAFLKKHHGQTIIHDPRLIWNTQHIAASLGGRTVQAPCGHTFIKALMRHHDAVYGGEMSAHHYFRDFAYCDSGMIPWLLIIELMSQQRASLSSLVSECIQQFPCSGEVNYRVTSPQQAIDSVLCHFEKAPDLLHIDLSDGLSMTFDEWRFNLRASQTEPLLRLNVESRGSQELVAKMLTLVESVISQYRYFVQDLPDRNCPLVDETVSTL